MRRLTYIALVALIVSGLAFGGPPKEETCFKKYAAPERVYPTGRQSLSFPTTPSGTDFVRCLYRTGQVPR